MNISLGLKGLGAKPLVPIADLEGSTKYSAEEVECRNKLASLCRLVDLLDWTNGIHNHVSLRLPNEPDVTLYNPMGLLFREITASQFAKVNVNGQVVDPGPTQLDIAGYPLHSAIHTARPDVDCILHLHTSSGGAVSMMNFGLLPVVQESMMLGEVAFHEYRGIVTDENEKKEMAEKLGDKKVLFLRNHGFALCARTVEEAYALAYQTLVACDTQVAALSAGMHNLILPDEETAKEVAHYTAKKAGGTVAKNGILWKVGELEWEAWMRQLDGAGYKTGHKYKLPALMASIEEANRRQ